MIYFNVLCYNVTLGNLPIGSVVYYNTEFEVCQPILEKNFFPNLLKTLDSFLHFSLAFTIKREYTVYIKLNNIEGILCTDLNF